MRKKLLLGLLITTALLILALPITVIGQSYGSNYDRSDRQDVHRAIRNLDNVSRRLESDLRLGRERRVLGGLFWINTVDSNAVDGVRDFRNAVMNLRENSRNGYDMDRSAGDARIVLDKGVALDRYLRLRTGRANVDIDLADLRSNLHTVADAYDLSMPY